MWHIEILLRVVAQIIRKKNKKKNTNVLIFLALFIVLVFVVGLYLLKNQNSKVSMQQAITQQEKAQPKSVLPNRPEEGGSYIKSLRNAYCTCR